MKLKGFVGKGTGKLGESVWSVFRGEQVVRHTAASVKNPKTPRQELSRAKFKLAVDLSRILNDGLLVGFSGVKTQTLSARNEFVKRIVPVGGGVITGDNPLDLQLDYSLLQVSRGNLPMPPVRQATASQAATVEIPYTAMPEVPSQYGPGEYGVVVVVYQSELGRSITHQVKPAASGVMKISVPADWSGTDCFVYAFGKVIPEAKNGIPSASEPWMYPSEASATQFCGAVTII